MKTSYWIGIGLAGLALYYYFTSVAKKLSFVLQGVGVSQNGLVTQLEVTMLVTSSSTTSVTLTNMQVSVIYDGNTVGTGLTPSVVIQPGNSNVTFPVNLSDISLVTDLASVVNSATQSPIVVTVKGSGLVDGIPASFAQQYQF